MTHIRAKIIDVINSAYDYGGEEAVLDEVDRVFDSGISRYQANFLRDEFVRGQTHIAVPKEMEFLGKEFLNKVVICEIEEKDARVELKNMALDI